MRTLVRILIRGYQITISPVVSFFGGTKSGCRFSPTCSEYFLRAVEEHGIWRGSFLGMKRLLRCHPWGAGDFVPFSPVCFWHGAAVWKYLGSSMLWLDRRGC